MCRVALRSIPTALETSELLFCLIFDTDLLLGQIKVEVNHVQIKPAGVAAQTKHHLVIQIFLVEAQRALFYRKKITFFRQSSLVTISIVSIDPSVLK